MPLVSVGIMAFKVGPYLAQALESVLMQECSFDYQIIISDDCSPDNSLEVCNTFKEKYPDKIVLIPCEKNLGIAQNFMRIMRESNTEYLAILDGDDYWTDPQKLQKSVQFLESYPEYSAVCHNVQLLQSDGRFTQHRKWHDNAQVTLEELIREMPGGIIAASSFTFRKKALKDLDWMENMAFNDYPIFVDVYRRGPIYGLKDVMGVYRKHTGGFTSGFNWDGYMQEYPKFYTAILNRVAPEIKPLVRRKIYEVYYHAGSQFIGRGQWQKGYNALKKMGVWRTSQSRFIKAFSSLAMKIFFYPVYFLFKKVK